MSCAVRPAAGHQFGRPPPDFMSRGSLTHATGGRPLAVRPRVQRDRHLTDSGQTSGRMETMFTISGSVCIDAAASKVSQVLSDLESIHVWVESIKRSYCVSSRTRGVDAVRVCHVEGNFTVRETIVDWVEGESFAYVGAGAPLMKHAVNQWRVEERGSQTLVTTSAQVELNWGVFGRLLEPLIAAVAKRMGSRSLAGLKYLVENGRPYPGNARKLLPLPSAC